MQDEKEQKGKKKSITLSGSRLSRVEIAESFRTDGWPVPVMPIARFQCQDQIGPCPVIRCVHHLAIDITKNGAIKVNFPDTDLADMGNTCALNVADRGEHTLEQVGDIMGLTRERVRQVEAAALIKLRVAGFISELWDVLGDASKFKR